MANRDAERSRASGVPAGDRETPFYIPATDAPQRLRRNLKTGDTFAIFDSHGDIGASAGGEDGLFQRDTRFLSHFEMLVAGAHPLLLHSAVADDNLSYHVDLTNPDIYADGRLALLKDTLHISRSVHLGTNSLHERIAFMNHGAETVTFSLAFSFASDFADIFEVRGMRRAKRGTAWSEPVSQTTAHLAYRGLDDVVRRTILRFEPAPEALRERSASYTITLAPHERCAIFLAVEIGEPSERTVDLAFFRNLVALRREHRRITTGTASVETANPAVNETLERASADLYMLLTETGEGPYPYAGIPWYSTTFGRDGIITAIETLWLDPSIAAGVLRRLAHLQAEAVDPAADAAPGKIVHEMRGGEMADCGEVPFKCYYGSVDATPLFVVLARLYGERTGDWRLVREIWPAIEKAIAWIDDATAADSDGFLTYARAEEAGLANQGWKDSYDSVFHADGRLAEGPIALAEVQGYAYAARHAAAACAAALGHHEKAGRLTSEAERLGERFEERFWCDNLGFYALALDGAGEPCRVRASNAGHLLWSAIAAPPRAASVAAALMRKDFFSGWGIRTVPLGEARYNPMSYHNGSIWPHDNAIIASGLAQTGAKDGVVMLFDALMRATSYFDLRRIPELYCGFRRRSGRGPTLYPAACAPQAWATGAPFSLIQSLLGLEFCPADHEIRLRNPVVPPIAGAITLRNVRLDHAVADFTVRDAPGGAAVEVLRTEGDIRIAIIAAGWTRGGR